MADIENGRGRVAWWVFGAAIGATVAVVLYSFVGTVVFALFIYYAARPLNAQLERIVPSRNLAAVLSLLALTIPTLFLLGYAFTIALSDLRSFLATSDLGPVIDEVAPGLVALDPVANPLTSLSKVDGATLQQLLRTTLDYLGFVGNGLLHVFIMFVLAFYLLRDDHRLGAWLHHHFDDDGGNVSAYLAAVDRDLHNIFFGNLLNILLTGTIGAVTFTLLNDVAPSGIQIPHPGLLGMLTGVASLIPVVGMKIVIVPVAGLLFGKAYLTGAAGGIGFAILFLLVSLVVVDAVPDLLLRPYISARGLHTGLVMIAYLLGPLLFGWYGLFLGPILLVVGLEFTTQVLPDLLADEPLDTSSTPASIRGEISAERSPLFAAVEWEETTGTSETTAADGESQGATE